MILESRELKNQFDFFWRERKLDHLSPTDRFSLFACIYCKPKELKWYVGCEACFLIWWETVLLLSPASAGLQLSIYSPKPPHLFPLTPSASFFLAPLLAPLPHLHWLSVPSSQPLTLHFSDPLNNVCNPAGQRGRASVCLRVQRVYRVYVHILCLVMLTTPVVAVAGLAAKSQVFTGAYFHSTPL